MKPIFLLVCIFFLSSSCTAKNYLYYKHTGYEINNKFKKLQGFNIDYEGLCCTNLASKAYSAI